MKVTMFSSLRRCARPALGAALLLWMAGASAQMFKWVDAKGVVHYSDTPPPPDQKKVELKAPGGGADLELPYVLAEAVRSHPVTLYTAASCNACDQGRAMLRERGIPFSEKTVASNEDQQKLKEAGSTGQVPLLLVGRDKLIGFEATAWNRALSDAAYPLQAMLPATYRQPAAAPAAPARAPSAPARPAARNDDAGARERAEAARRTNPNAPPGFQF
jgi:glutaredoxin